jgi:LysR family nod box-dependent transcriptional activator
MRFHNLDLNLLVVLDSLLQERSVSQTAQELRLTQPAISNALSRLRLHFEDDLLVQVGRKMVPTPFAETLAEPVRQALDDLRRIVVTRSEFDPSVG